MRTRNAFLAMAFLAGWLASCGGDGRTPLVVYSPHGRDLLALFEERFETAHPEVDVRWLDMGSQDVLERIRFEAANPQCDVWFGGPATIFERGAAEGLLARYRPAWMEAVPAASRHPGDLFFGVYRTPAVIVYNAAAVPPEEAPRDWDDLLEPRWKGRLIIRDPLASGIMRTVFGMILARSVGTTGDAGAGFVWLARLDAQTKEYVQNPALMLTKLARQEAVLTIWGITDVLLQREQGVPLRYRFPTSGTPVIDDSVGLVAGARHPGPARAYIDWVGSREAQLLAARRVFFLPARTDLPASDLPEWAVEVDEELVPAPMDWELVSRRGPEWMQRWDRTIRGRGGAAR